MDPRALRIVFLGTPDFAVESLRALVEGKFNICAVVTAPDKPAGRGLKLSQSAVKQYAAAAGLKIMQPVSLKDPAFIREFKDLEADLGIVIAFRMLPEVIWSAPKMGTFNLHASLLPQYRGAAPINRAVMNGETETGVTTFFLRHEIDTGDIICRQGVTITYEDTAGTLHDKLMYVGRDLVVRTVELVASGHYSPLAQPLDDKTLKTAPKIFREDCRIDWTQAKRVVYNHIRGLSPYPAAWSEVENKVTGEVQQWKIYMAGECPDTACPENMPSGELLTDSRTFIKVACADGWIEVGELQAAGKKRMGTEEFLRGFKNISDWRMK